MRNALRVSPAAQVVLGLDIGTTSAKAVAFAPDGSALGDAAAGYPLHEPEPGRAEQDPPQAARPSRSACGGVASNW